MPTIVAINGPARGTGIRLDYCRNVENRRETLCNIFPIPDGREGLAFVEKRWPNWRDGPSVHAIVAASVAALSNPKPHDAMQ